MKDYMKKALLIMNPCAGLKKANRVLTEIVAAIEKDGYLCTTFITEGRGDAQKLTAMHGKEYDIVVAVGGDGTFNEMVSGMVSGDLHIPIGYIPAGSTNDFASSLKLSLSPIKAARDIAAGKLRGFDIGSFNGRVFTYIASFGAFTNASYSTPQELKNFLGHAAYILEGSKGILNLKNWHVKIETEDKTFEDDYIFGAVSNSTSIAGLLKMNPEVVDMNDGLFEIMLIRTPKNLNELAQILNSLTTMKYENCKAIDFCTAKKVKIYADKKMNWTLDGEKENGKEYIEVENLENRLQIFVP